MKYQLVIQDLSIPVPGVPSWSIPLCSNHNVYFGCLGHIAEEDIKTNRIDSQFYNGEDTAIVLDIDIDAKVVRHTCLARKKETTVQSTVALGIGDDIVDAGAKFTVGQTTYIAITESVKETVNTPVVSLRDSVYAGVDFDRRALCSAHADFDFEGNDFDEGSVWYQP